MTDQPTEGWLARKVGPGTVTDVIWPLIPAVSVVESDRRVTEARQAERDRCLAIVAEELAQLPAALGPPRHPERVLRRVRAAIAAGIESGEPA